MFDLTDGKQQMEQRGEYKNVQTISHNKTARNQLKDGSEFLSTLSVHENVHATTVEITDQDSADLQEYSEVNEEAQQMEEEVPWFERPQSLPVFTTPFAQTAWQPSHLKSTHSEHLSNFWSFTGLSSSEDKEKLLRDNNEEGDDCSSSSDDEDMIQPLRPVMGLRPSISPIGRDLFSSPFRPYIPPNVRFPMQAAMKEPVHTKKFPMRVSEPFPRPPGSSLRQILINRRLSAIPEESPELTRSARSSNINITAASTS